MWYAGHAVDMVGAGALRVGFDADVWPLKQYPTSSVRKPPKLVESDPDKFTPRIGDEVELRINATEHAPAGWSRAIVKNIKHEFYFLSRVSSSSTEGSAE